MIENLAEEPNYMGAAGGLGVMGAVGALETLGSQTDVPDRMPDEGYSEVAYPSLNDPTQAPPQQGQQKSSWLFPLVLFGITGWVLALIGLSYWLKDQDSTQPPVTQPTTGSPAPSVPPAPASP